MKGRLLRAAVLALGLLFAGASAAEVTPAPSAAAPAPAPTPSLVIDALPLLGPGIPSGERWVSVVVRLYNAGEQQLEGNIEVTAALPWGRDETELVTRAPFALAGKARVALQLPTHGFLHSPPQIRVRAVDAAGKEIGESQVPDPRPIEPLLFDLTVPSRIAPGLRGVKVATQYTTPLRGTYGAPSLSVSAPQVNPATGEPVLPDRSAGYASASLILAKSEQLVALAGPELDALVHWVMGGGALAIVVTRPEDLRTPTLVALAGAEARPGAPPKALGPSEFVIPSDSTGYSPYSSPYGYHAKNVVKRASPGGELSGKLVGYSGGNLHESPWGASASYGLGEVHLLGFDATRDPFVSDEWVKLKVADLVRHSWDRQVNIALAHGTGALDPPGLEGIRKQLDPNEGARWAIVVALLILIIYSMLAGPLNFYLAAKKGHPLRALRNLPIWAGATMGLIVVLGAFAKGVTGRARHLSLIEAGAGMSRASITRFRGFYSSAAERLLVRATDRGNVLDVAGDPNETARQLVVDRDGARLERFQSKPWQTVVVREDGFTSLGGGISLIAKGGDVEVKNRAARDLLGVIVLRPKADATYFPRIKDGESVLASSGRKLPKKIGSVRYFGTMSVRDLDAKEFSDVVEADVKGAGPAWEAFNQIAPRSVNWWPDDVPVLIAQLEGGEGKTSDSGLRLDTDRVLVRVVGWGGVP